MGARPVTLPVGEKPAIRECLVIDAAELVTLADLGPGPHRGALSELSAIPGGAVWMGDGVIRDVGTTEDVLRRLPTSAAPEVIDARGCAVIPGLVDAHSHLLYEGTREDEYLLRLRGTSYLEIGRRGGGIQRTVAATRAAGFDRLLQNLGHRLDRVLAGGTTTVEVKTGYGLDTATEVLGLEVIRAAQRLHPIDVTPTFLGAHAVPPELRDAPARYVDLVIEEMLPRVKDLAAFCDVFCEHGYFTRDQSRRILEEAKRHGLRGKIHADELTDQGAASLAAEVGATSADHLCCASESGLRALAQTGVVAVVLPATRFYFLAERYADARRMLELGVPVALGTDHSPTTPVDSMTFVLALACAELRLTPEEALVAATLNAACALGLGDRIGSLAVGRQADLVVLDLPSYRYIPYYASRPVVRAVLKRGKVIEAAHRLGSRS